MMGLSTIRQMNRERAREAVEEGIEPFTYDDVADVGQGSPVFPFPHIGDHVPDGWTKDERFFVDSSGFGRSDEPALTAHKMLAKVRELVAEHGDDVGFAIVEAGQFQVWVASFLREVGA